MKSGIAGKILAAALLLGAGSAVAASRHTAPAPQTDSDIALRIAHAVAMYPRYSIWDAVYVQVTNGQAQLSGAVNQPFKKDDIERIVKEVPGVVGVADQVKVLPLSPIDDQLRLRLARAIYGDPTLSRYAGLAAPPIHILVENGHVTLDGVVSNEMEKNIAGIRASGAGMSFGPVVNNLVVENPPARKS